MQTSPCAQHSSGQSRAAGQPPLPLLSSVSASVSPPDCVPDPDESVSVTVIDALAESASRSDPPPFPQPSAISAAPQTTHVPRATID